MREVHESYEASVQIIGWARSLFLLRYMIFACPKFLYAFVRQTAKFYLGWEVIVIPFNFYPMFILHVFGIKKIKKVTCICPPGEGAGSQALMIMHAIDLCRKHGLIYCHAPFKKIAHEQKTPPEWAIAWENLFNFGIGETIFKEKDPEIVNYSYNLIELEVLFNRSRGWGNLSDEVILELKRKFRHCSLSIDDQERKQVHFLSVAVHIRRGDVSKTKNSHMWTSNETIILSLNELRSVINEVGIPYQISIYSEGNLNDFREFSEMGARFFINEDATLTMSKLINSDIILTGKSSFSYVAGIISDGIVITESYPRPNNWIELQPDGHFDLVDFRKKLIKYVNHSRSN